MYVGLCIYKEIIVLVIILLLLSKQYIILIHNIHINFIMQYLSVIYNLL